MTEKMLKVQTREQLIQRVGLPQLFFTTTPVRGSEAYAAVPKGFRMARMDEIVKAWSIYQDFRLSLYNSEYAVWVDQTSLPTSGPHKIEGGGFLSVDMNTYITLEPKEKAYHYPGSSLVALDGGMWSNFRLGVRGDGAFGDSEEKALVAYVKLENGEQNSIGAMIADASSLRRTASGR